MPAIKTLMLFPTIALAAVATGAWELSVTRVASILFYHDIAYLVLALCLMALGLGALLAHRYDQSPGVLQICIALPVSMLAAAYGLAMTDIAWIGGMFALPFLLFGALSVRVWREVAEVNWRRYLFSTELAATVFGMIWLGPILMQHWPIDVLGDVGVQTHLKNTVAREGVRSIKSISSTYARTDYLETTNPAVRYVFTDGMFVTRSVRWDGESKKFLDPDVEGLAAMKRVALRSGDPQSVLLLGAGAGFDIAVALQEQTQVIEAVEINPFTVALARELDRWAGGVMSHPFVTVHIAEARRFVQASDKKWDQINLTLLQTSPASPRGRQHIDARVLTVEAVETYLARLKPRGTLAVIQNSPELADATNQVMRTAISGAENRLLNFELADRQENPFAYLSVVRNEPFSENEVTELLRMAAGLGVKARQPAAARSIAPATDDRPYFFETGSSLSFQAGLIAALAFVFTVIALVFYRRDGNSGHPGVLATLVGGCTMAFQIIAVYWCQSAIGNPTLALSIALAAVLGGAGIGVLVLGNYCRGSPASYAVGLTAAFSSGLLILLGPHLVSLTGNLSTTEVAFLMSVFILLCSLPIGLPFFYMINLISARDAGLVIGFDGLGSVLGATVATFVAMHYGFSALGLLVVLGLVIFSLVAALGSRGVSQNF